MESCSAVEKELERVVTKFTAIRDHSDKVISDVTTLFDDIKRALEDEKQDESISERHVEILNEALAKTKDKMQRITTEHRDLHGTVSKVGKVIDRNFVSDFTSTARTDALTDDKNLKLLNAIIAQHYYRQGMDAVADSLIKESGLSEEFASKISTNSDFTEIFKIYESILNHDLAPALDWAARHSEQLEAKNSALEFKLHRLAFMQILLRGVGAQTEAIAYARNNFAKFVNRFQKEFQNLMGTLIYLPSGIQNSPYKHLISPEMWAEASYIFLKDACTTLNISKDSPLSVVVNAGCTTLSALLNLKQVMLSRQVLGILCGRDELPIEIDLDPENRYHSTFACPILRQQTSEDNPPMKLTCGHVISRDALNKLSNGPILKCPYCPMEQSTDLAKFIYF
uniref:Putative e3 ubiquitin ligase n=1 Tax=Tabanus bromius TaxID=304241 RepID=A0A0K8TSL5_TABBR